MRRATAGWVLYDLANTVFALGVVGLYFPAWLTESDQPDRVLAVITAGAGGVLVFAGPWVGAFTDRRKRRLPTLFITTLVAVIATALLASGPVPLTLVLAGIAIIAVNLGSVVYDALLPAVSTTANRGTISGRGVGVGYLGSFIGLGIGALTLDRFGYRITFVSLALAFALFSIPVFVWVKEAGGQVEPSPRLSRVVTDLIASWKRARQVPHLARFLVSRFLYTDAINTLIGGFLAIYVIEELGLGQAGARRILAISIVGAIAGGLGSGKVVERIGAKQTLRLALAGWVIAIAAGVAASLSDSLALAYAIGSIGGLSLGATWTADRVVMVRLSPADRLGEFYGLYATVGRFATVLGPLAWTLVADGLGLGRPTALATMALFIGTGWVVVGGVVETPGVRPDPASR